MTQELDPVQAAMQRAKDAATQAAQVPALATPASTAVGVPAAIPQKFSMETMAAGGMTVDKWLKVNEDGIKIGDSKFVQGDLLASIDMTEGSGFILKMAIKGGNPAQYAYTTDNVNSTTGGSWEAAQARIRALPGAQGAAPYRSVDLPFTAIADIKDMTGQVVAKEGDTLGYATSTTNWANWVTFHKQVADAGLMNTRVVAKLTAQARSNTKGNKWGVLKMELVGSAESE